MTNSNDLEAALMAEAKRLKLDVELTFNHGHGARGEYIIQAQVPGMVPIARRRIPFDLLADAHDRVGLLEWHLAEAYYYIHGKTAPPKGQAVPATYAGVTMPGAVPPGFRQHVPQKNPWSLRYADGVAMQEATKCRICGYAGTESGRCGYCGSKQH